MSGLRQSQIWLPRVSALFCALLESVIERDPVISNCGVKGKMINLSCGVAGSDADEGTCTCI
jgi:hypothetical protein